MPGNKQVKLKHYAPAVLKETDMEVTSSDITLELQSGTQDVLVKNLYLSCDPYMRHRLTGLDYSHHPSFKTGQVNRLSPNPKPFLHTHSLVLVISSHIPDVLEIGTEPTLMTLLVIYV